MVQIKNQKGISLMTLIITIVVIIMFALMTLKPNSKTVDDAVLVKFKQEITEVKKGVETVKLINSKEGLTEEILNQNFKKVEVENPPENFASFDNDKLTGYVVDLEEIDYKKIKTGQGYKEVNEGDTVKFDVDDVYVYDKQGTVYYVKGAYLGGDELYYTAEEKKSVGPIVIATNTEGGKIQINVTPVKGGEITSVKVGDEEATKVSEGVYEFEVEENGNYIVTATEKDSGTTKVTVKVNKIDDGEGDTNAAPTTANIKINSNEIYTNTEKATLYIDTDAEYVYIKHVTNGSVPNVPSATASGWRKKVEESPLYLSEGINDVYVWFRNSGNNTILSETATIYLDTVPPTRTKPTVEIVDGFTFKVTSNQRDTGSGLSKIEIGYKLVGESSYTWIEVPDVTNPTIEIPNNIPGENYSIISRAEDNSGLVSESLDYMTGKLSGIPDGIIIKNEPQYGYTAKSTVTITYPNESASTAFERWYRINEGEWKVVNSLEEVLYVVENVTIEAVVVRKTNTETIFGEIVSLTISNIDATSPIIGYTDLDPINTENGSNFKATTEVTDFETGIIRYAVTETDSEPTTWETLTKPAKTIIVEFNANIGKTYYIWAKDEAGNGAKKKVEVEAIDIITNPDVAISIENTEYDYTGLEIKPEVTITYKGTNLEEGNNYEIKYENNVDAGTAKVTITGKGAYAGTKEIEFEILSVEPTITLENTTYLFTNTVQPIKEAKVTGVANGSTPNGEITYTYHKDQNLTIKTTAEDGAIPDGTAPSKEGTYYVVAQIAEKDNYKEATSNTAKLQIQPRPIKITFNANGGSAAESERIVYYGKTYGEMPEVERVGYTFTGWYTVSGDKIESTTKVNIMAEHELKASWLAKENTEYKVEHWIQNVNGADTQNDVNYTLKETENLTGKTDVTVTPAVKTYTGFTAPATQTAIIAADGTLVVKYYYKRNSYIITFNTNGGSAVSAITAKYEATVNAPSNPTRNGYEFARWDKEIPTTMPAEDMTINASWNVITYTITYDLAEGTVTGNPDSYTIETEDITLKAPTKTGYTFTGWTGSNGNTAQTSVTITKGSTGNKEYTANWKANTNTAYKVEHWQQTITGADTQNDTNYVLKETDNLAGTTGAEVTPTLKTYTGFTAPTAQKVTIAADGSTVVKYYYKRNSYKITFNANGGSAVDAITAKYGATVTAPADPTKNGYTFAGWDKEVPSTMPAEDITITAKWNTVSYTITYNLDGGTVTGNPDSYTIETANITLKAPTKAGYTFTGWTGSNGNTAQTTVTITKGSTGNKEYTANWKANGNTAYKVEHWQQTITGADTQNDTNYVLKETDNLAGTTGAEVTPTLKTYTGFTAPTAQKVTIAPDGSTLVKYYYKRNSYTITFNANGGSAVDAITAKYGATVTIPADPTKTGYTFAGWDKTVPTTMPASNQTITAKWTAAEYTITLDPTGGTLSTTTLIVKYGGTYGTLPVPTSTIATFVGWFTAVTGGTEVTSTTTVGTSANGQTLYARWNITKNVAIYSATDTSLTFLKPTTIPVVGSTYNEKAVTAMYTGIENTNYTSSNLPAWNEYANLITSVKFENEFAPSNTAYWFNGFSKCTSIDLAKLNTANVTDMRSMFKGCSSLTTLDVSGFVTNNVTKMHNMFHNCSSLTALDVSNFNTANVTDMKHMFEGCSLLTTLDVSNFKTSNVENMEGMFNNCSALTILDVSNFNTEKVSNMSYIFRKCSNLTTLDVSNFKTSNAENMEGMFDCCFKLTTLNVTGFDTSKVTSMAYMFNVCEGLTSLDVSNFNTSNVTKMNSMFNCCRKLTTIDVSGFNTEKVTEINSMFSECIVLEKLDLTNFDTSKVTSMTNMFNKCQKLQEVTVGSKFEWKGTDGYLPAQTSTNIPGADGKWYNIATGTGYEPANVPGSTLATYSAIPMYKVTLDPTGGTLSTTTLIVKYGGTYGTLHVPTSTIATFVGWFTAVTGGTEVTSTTTVGTSANGQTLYARWNVQNVAIYSATDTSLTFLKPTSIPVVGSTYNEKAVTAMYTGIENTNYTSSNLPAWNEYASLITSVKFENEFAPSNTAYWFNGFSKCTSLDLAKLKTDNVTDMRAMFKDCSLLTTLDVSGFVTNNVTKMHYMFHNCSSLTTLDVSKFNTEKVSNMSYMFGNCSNLTTLDVSNFKTSNVENMEGMFGNCKKLTTINVTGFNTEKVSSMAYMFNVCEGLTSLDVSNFNTSSVTKMNSMFNVCSKLTEINVSSWNTANVTEMKSMFAECHKLEKLDLRNFDTSKVTSMTGMFTDCYKLQEVTLGSKFVWKGTDGYLPTPSSYYIPGADGKWYNIATGTGYAPANVPGSTLATYSAMPMYKVRLDPTGGTLSSTEITVTYGSTYGTLPVPTSTIATFVGWFTLAEGGEQVTETTIVGTSANGQTLYARWNITKNVAIYSATDKSFTILKPTSIPVVGSTYNGKIVTAMYTGIENTNYTSDNLPAWNEYASLITSVKFENEFAPSNTAYWFNGFSKCTSIDLAKLNTANVTDMRSMFRDCSSLTALDVSGFVTNNVTKMHNMFKNCSALTALDVSKFNTEKVTNMQHMFNGCSNLRILDVSGFVTNSVTYMGSMFRDCSLLTVLDVSGFVTNNVTEMTSMFHGCSAITTLDVNKFNTEKVTNMSYMFCGCSSLATLDVSNFKTSNVNSMEGMFGDCKKLTTLDVSGFDTVKVTSMSWMFNMCETLTNLEVSNFNTSNVTKMNSMFNCCRKLTIIDVSGFNTTNVTEMKSMFAECHKLEKLDLTNFDTSKVTSMTNMFNACYKLQEVTLGLKFEWKGTDGYLPTPNSYYITGADGKWYNIATGTGYAPANVPGSALATYSAMPMYKVTLDPIGGTISTTTLTVKYGSTYGEAEGGLPSATRDGYNFLGWFTEIDGGTQITENTVVDSTAAGLTLYAHWKKVVKIVANPPVLGDGMKAVYWTDDNGTEEITADDFTTDMYSYVKGDGKTDSKDSKWANAITESDGSYWVWIPRYAYKITYYTDNTKTTVSGTTTSTATIDGTKTLYGDIDILFMYGTSDTEYYDEQGNIKNGLPEGFKVHPAFQKMTTIEDLKTNPLGKWGRELEGIWVAKYEASRETSSDGGVTWTPAEGTDALTTGASRVVSKPSTKIWKKIAQTNSYQNSLNMHTVLNSHEMKASEWGAVAYLTQSAYGRNGNEIAVNQCTDYYTGGGPGTGDSTIYNSTYTYDESTFATTYAWNTTQGKIASTTGNIYGVYDMSGGTSEIIAAYVNNGYVGITTETWGGVLGTTKNMMTKQLYPSNGATTGGASSAAYELINGVYGDAVYETSIRYSSSYAWNSDGSWLPYAGNPFFTRGDSCSSTTAAGLYYFSAHPGNNTLDRGFRPVLCIGEVEILTPPTYEVTFNANGGTIEDLGSTTTTRTVTEGSTYGEAEGGFPEAIREGYTFNGWFTAATDGTQVTANTQVTGEVPNTLYAQWIVKSYTYNIVYQTESGIQLGTDTVSDMFGETKLVSPKAFTGYTSPAAQSVAWDSTTAKTITFTYAPINYTISYTKDNRLPDGYTSLEYIESSGAQYIDTGVVWDTNNLKFEGKYAYTELMGHSSILGTQGNQNLILREEGGKLTLWYASNSGTQIATVAPGQIIDFEITGSSAGTASYKVCVNGANSAVGNSTIDTSYDSNGRIYLFDTHYTVNGGRGSAAASTIMCKARLYALKITKNGTLVRNFIPCLNASGVAGLYDTVEGKFYANAGTGSFASTSLPAGYTELEYIESTGTQYIDTGFAAPEGFYGEAGVVYTEVMGNYIVGSHNEGAPYGRNGVGLNHLTNWEIGTGDTCPASTEYASAGTYYDLDFSTLKGNSYLNVNGNRVITTTDSSSRSAYNLLVFQNQYTLNSGGGTTKIKLYYLKLYNNSKALVRNFIPAMNSSGVVGLYDTVTGTFYTNVGSGTFTAGPKYVTSYNIESAAITLPTPSRTGYRFTGWTGTGLSSATTSVTIPAGSTENRNYKANWSVIEYTITTNYSNLPSGYTMLDYIQSTGTQWINTGVQGAARWEVDIQFTDTTTRQLMGYGGSGSEYWGVQTNGMYGLATWGYMNYAAGNRDTVIHNYGENGKYYIQVGNTVQNVGVTDITGKSYALFNLNGGDYYCKSKLYGVKTIQNGVVIRDFVPCKNASGTVGLYDMVTGTFYGNSGTGSFTAGSTVSSYTVNKKYTVETPAYQLPTLNVTGYTFNGWTGTGLTTTSKNVVIPTGSTGNRNYVASFTINSYTVTYNGNGGTITGLGSTTTTRTVTNGSTYGAAPAGFPSAERSGYTFNGWYTATSGGTQITSSTVCNLTGNQTLYAQWTAAGYTNTVNHIIYGTGVTEYQFATTTFSRAYGESITLNSAFATTVPSGTQLTHYGTAAFAGTWTSYYVSNANTVTQPANAVAINCYYQCIDYTISYTLNGGSASNKTSYNRETASFTLTNPTRTGYTFTGWTGTGLSSASKSVTVAKGSTGNRSYTANWSANSYTYNIVYKSSSGTQLGTATVTNTFGTTASVSPKGFTGYNSPSAQNVTWDSTSAKTITFTYTPTSYSISYTLNGGSASNKTSYTIETASFTLSNPTRSGYTFTGWTGTGLSSASTSVTISKGSTGNRSYTANWKQNGVALSSISEGSIVMINENGTATEFYVAKHNYESGLNGNGRTLLVRKNVHSVIRYRTDGYDVEIPSLYDGSNLDKWCTGTYYNTLDSGIRSAIGTTKIPATKKYWYSTTLSRSVFVLSATELGAGGFQDYHYVNTEGSALPIASTLRNLGRSQYTRTPANEDDEGSDNIINVAFYVNASNQFATHSVYWCEEGARPCFTLPSTMNFIKNSNGTYTPVL